MPKITFVYADKSEKTVEVPNGISIMEAVHVRVRLPALLVM
jgi:hypothetical protein